MPRSITSLNWLLYTYLMRQNLYNWTRWIYKDKKKYFACLKMFLQLVGPNPSWTAHSGNDTISHMIWYHVHVYQHIAAETKWWPFHRGHLHKCIFLNENVRISLKISLKFMPKVRIKGTAHLKQHSYQMAIFSSGMKIFKIAFQHVVDNSCMVHIAPFPKFSHMTLF